MKLLRRITKSHQCGYELTNNKIIRKTYRTLLEEQEIEAFECDNPHALRLAQPLSVSKLPNFEQGAVTVQDLNAQWSALLLEPQNGD